MTFCHLLTCIGQIILFIWTILRKHLNQSFLKIEDHLLCPRPREEKYKYQRAFSQEVYHLMEGTGHKALQFPEASVMGASRTKSLRSKNSQAGQQHRQTLGTSRVLQAQVAQSGQRGSYEPQTAKVRLDACKESVILS